jgi:hypothetical protein
MYQEKSGNPAPKTLTRSGRQGEARQHEKSREFSVDGMSVNQLFTWSQSYIRLSNLQFTTPAL